MNNPSDEINIFDRINAIDLGKTTTEYVSENNLIFEFDKDQLLITKDRNFKMTEEIIVNNTKSFFI